MNEAAFRHICDEERDKIKIRFPNDWQYLNVLLRLCDKCGNRRLQFTCNREPREAIYHHKCYCSEYNWEEQILTATKTGKSVFDIVNDIPSSDLIPKGKKDDIH